MEIQAIKTYMKKEHITYDELAKRSGLSISTIKKIFSGISQYPRIDTMQAIEAALELNQPLNFTEEETQTLSNKEKELLSYFNLLPTTLQDQIIQIAKTLYQK